MTYRGDDIWFYATFLSIDNGCKKFKVFQIFSHTPLNRYKENVVEWVVCTRHSVQTRGEWFEQRITILQKTKKKEGWKCWPYVTLTFCAVRRANKSETRDVVVNWHRGQRRQVMDMSGKALHSLCEPDSHSNQTPRRGNYSIRPTAGPAQRTCWSQCSG